MNQGCVMVYGKYAFSGQGNRENKVYAISRRS